MKPRCYEILVRALEEGTQAGYRVAHKHSATPSENVLLEALQRELMNSILEVFSFDHLPES